MMENEDQDTKNVRIKFEQNLLKLQSFTKYLRQTLVFM